MKNEPPFTLGVEEEYLLVDKDTRELVVDPPATLMAEAEEACGEQVTSELLRSQIEIGTSVCANVPGSARRIVAATQRHRKCCGAPWTGSYRCLNAPVLALDKTKTHGQGSLRIAHT